MKLSEMFPGERSERDQALSDVREAVQERLQTSGRRLDGLSEDSYATKIEVHDEIGFLRRFDQALGKSDGRSVDLSRTITDYGYDQEAAAAEQSVGLDYVPEAERQRGQHEASIGAVSGLVERLEQAGVKVDTSFRTVEPEMTDREEHREWTRERDRENEQAAADLKEPISQRDAVHLINQVFDAADLSHSERLSATQVLDNAAAYRLDAPTDNRHAREPTVFSVAQEWQDRGVTRETAFDLVDRTIGLIQSRRDPDPEPEREQGRER